MNVVCVFMYYTCLSHLFIVYHFIDLMLSLILPIVVPIIGQSSFHSKVNQ